MPPAQLESPAAPVALLEPTHRRDWLRSLLCAVGLSLFFFAVYSTCNAITAHRSDVGHAGFAWERHIPFVPVMIVPYMSIDLFFFLAPFLCTTQLERSNHVRRMLLAIGIAGICFLLFPLTTSFVRPPPSGIFAPVFQFLYGFDRPYNLAPSLHITLRTLLWVIYISHTRGLLRAAIKVWFILIGISTLVTYQHQVIDLVTGQFLGLVCLSAFPETMDRRTHSVSLRIAIRYLMGAACAAITAYLLRPWGLLLLWPAAALALVGWAYLGGGPAIYRKRGGRLPLSTYIVFAPYLIGTRLAFWFHRGRDVLYSEIVPGLFIGRRVRRFEADDLVAAGITAVLDLTAECPEAEAFRNVAYHNVPMLDLIPPSVEKLQESVAFIQGQIRTGRVYVHCAWGYSRSACVAAAYPLSVGMVATVEEGIERVRAARPKVVVGRGLQEALRRFKQAMDVQI